VVHNYPEDLTGEIPIPPYDLRANLVGYAGGLTAARGVEQMIDGLGRAGLPDDWRLRLVGPHSPANYIDRLRIRDGWNHVDYHSCVAPPEARRLMAECRIGLALLQPIGQNVDVVPTKLFEYMSLGIPVIASDYPACRAVVVATGCGLLVDPSDPHHIGGAIRELANDPRRARAMGERGREAVAREFNWAIEESRLLDVYRHLVAQQPAAARKP
jgi:glycosyltransferase involved in cell wall biosynthesis